MKSTASVFGVPFISIKKEIGAYEALWAQPTATVKKLADLFKANPGALPSDLIHDAELIADSLSFFEKKIKESEIESYGVRINGTIDFPEGLKDAANPIEMLYFQGDWSLIESPRRIAIVGSRNPSADGIQRAAKLTKLLVENGFVIYSGLAKGIDFVAHSAAIEFGGKTVAVIGTPITEYYPPENIDLQKKIAKEHLLISQVPLKRYNQQDYRFNRYFFPERNATMSALTQATVIVEASDTSGTLTQARAALAQGRKLFILESCFNNPDISWPQKYVKKGAIRVSRLEDITENLSG